MKLEAIVSTVLAVLGHGLWGGAVIALAAWALIRLLGNETNATTRHAIWGAALAGIAVLHIALAVGLWPKSEPALVVLTELQSPETPDVYLSLTAGRPVPAVGTEAALSPTPPSLLTTMKGVETTSEAAPVDGFGSGHIASRTEAAGDAAWSPTLTLPRAWFPIGIILGIVLWLGAALMMIRLVRSLLAVHRLKERALPVPPEIRLRVLGRIPSLKRPVVLAESGISSPVAAGLGTPMVLIPVRLKSAVDTETFDQLLLHEVAHLERWDDWAMFLQRGLEAVLWYHPAVRFLGDRMLLEREAACDEWVVAATRQPEAYASSLGRMIELRLVPEWMPVPALAAQESQVVRRVRRLLAMGRRASARLSREKTAVAVALIALVVTLSLIGAPRIGFRAAQSAPFQVASLDSEPSPPPLAPLPPAAPLAGQAPLPSLAPQPAAAPQREEAPQPAAAPQPEGAPQPEEAPLPEVELQSAEALQPLASQPGNAVWSTPGVRSGQVPLLQAAHRPGPEPEPRAGTQPDATLRPTPADLTIAGWTRLLEVAGTIASEGDRAQILIDASGRMPSDPRVQAGFLDIAESIRSSGERSRVLISFVRNQKVADSLHARLVQIARSIPGSSERERVLAAIAH